MMISDRYKYVLIALFCFIIAGAFLLVFNSGFRLKNTAVVCRYLTRKIMMKNTRILLAIY